MNLLSINALTVSYGPAALVSQALSGIDLSIDKGERVAVIGESGSGKSTLALAIAGLLPRSVFVRGSISWPGLAGPARNGADIGFVFQDSNATLDPVVSVGRQIAEVVRTHLGMNSAKARVRAIQLLDRVRLPDPSAIYDAFPHQLSGGQRQRVGIAAAIAAEPVLLIADEPTSALDTLVQAEIMSLIDDLIRETNMSLLLVSHDIALAANHADRVVVMRKGVIEEIGTTLQVVGNPKAAYTQLLLSSVLSISKQLDDNGPAP